MRRSPQRWAAVVALPVIGFAAGYLSRPSEVARVRGDEKQSTVAPRASRSAAGVTREMVRSPHSARLSLIQSGGPARFLEEIARDALRDDPIGVTRMNEELAGADVATLRELTEYLIESSKQGPEGQTRAVYQQQRSLLVALFHRLSSADPKLAVEILTGAGKMPARGEIQQLVFSNYTLQDPTAAMAQLAGMDGDLLSASLEGVMSALSTKDPEAALELLQRYPGSDHDNEREKLIEFITASDPARAKEMVQSMLASGASPSVAETFLEGWLRKDPAAAAEWAQSYQGQGASVVKAAFLSRIADADPERAAQAWHGEPGIDPERAPGLSGAIVKGLVAKDPAAGKRWVDSLPDGPAKLSGVGMLADRWSRVDLNAASSYLASLPEGELRDVGAAKFASAINREHPAEAFSWVATLPAGGVKDRVMNEVMQGWRIDDPPAAEKAWADYVSKQR